MNLRYLLLFVISISFIFSCARRGRPTGGPIDEDRPIMVKAVPDFGSTNFSSDEIKIYFDEYIKLKNFNSQFIVSPPLKYPPIITPQGTPSKFITIKIKDTLLENTTYTFNFGQSVIDNTEGNILDNFKYIISTGDYIDSLKVSGTIKDARELEINEDIVVMLYEINDEYNDSIIFDQKPMYVGALKDSIHFEITNIKAGDYALVALNDVSKNYKYNPKGDKIGFYKDIVTAPTTDTTYNLVLFNEILPFRLPKKPMEANKGHLLFAYEGNADSLKVEPYSKTGIDFSSFANFDKVKDTLHYWFTGYERDSIEFIVKNKGFLDTVNVKLREENIDSLVLSQGIRSVLDLRDTLNMTTNIPVSKVDTSKINFLDIDSVKVAYMYNLNSSKNKLYLEFEKKHDSKYTLQALPGTVTDIFGVQNDTLNMNFSTKRPANYSSIYVNLMNVKQYPIIVDLINERGNIEASFYAESQHEIKFVNISPSRYMVRITYDTNANKKWDTGNYLNKEQPEEVYYFTTIIEAKANWEVNETLTIQ